MVVYVDNKIGEGREGRRKEGRGVLTGRKENCSEEIAMMISSD